MKVTERYGNKVILVFGDSNTYGLKPDGSGRYDFEERYTGRLQMLLKDEYRIIEEGCPGRTTVFEDLNRPYKRGLDYITPCLQSHSPLDLVVVMLGTNDCKSAFRATSEDIAAGLSAIIGRIKSSQKQLPRILILSPPHLGDHIGETGFDPAFDKASLAVSKSLANAYRQVAQKENCSFFDVATVARVSPIDQEHFDEIGHIRLSEALTKIILEQQPGQNNKEQEELL